MAAVTAVAASPCAAPLPLPPLSSSRARLPRMKGAAEEGEEVEKDAGVVQEPVAAMMEGSSWRSSHSMVWPSDLWPSSRVSWNTRAAQMVGIRMRRPRPSTLLCRSLDGALRTASAPPPPF
uniref:Uncharacterized protein n=1 Tax=Triticum urartu TaxID=4572 RepID=A0A8R7PPN8_TRIUA